MLQFEVNGYQYVVERDYEDDNIKNYHYCYKRGREIKMPVEFYNTSPYRILSRDEFAQYVRTVEVFIQG